VSQRDQGLEHLLLATTVRAVGREYLLNCRPYIAAVEDRLQLGARRYGDDGYLRRDCLRELLEETPDVAGWALLALQCPVEAADPTVFEALRQVMLHGALADHHARRALRVRGAAR
jgi:hypothetical protein